MSPTYQVIDGTDVADKINHVSQSAPSCLSDNRTLVNMTPVATSPRNLSAPHRWRPAFSAIFQKFLDDAINGEVSLLTM